MTKRLLNWLISKIVKIDFESVVISFDKLNTENKARVIEEAKYFKKTLLWDLLMVQTDRKIKENMFEKSSCWDDIFVNKAALYVLNLIKAKVDKIINFNQTNYALFKKSESEEEKSEEKIV
jgi:hypothetical protein